MLKKDSVKLDGNVIAVGPYRGQADCLPLTQIPDWFTFILCSAFELDAGRNNIQSTW